MSKKNFRKLGKMTLRRSRDGGYTLYSAVTVESDDIVAEIGKVSRETDQTPAKILKRFIEAAYFAGVEFE